MNLKLSVMMQIFLLTVGNLIQQVICEYHECSDLDGFYGTLEQHSFRLINNWLNERLQFHQIYTEKHVFQVFNELADLLDDTNKQLILHLAPHHKELYKKAESMLNSLNRIARLAGIDSSNICGNSSFSILLDNDEATGYKIHQSEDEYFTLGPIERVLLYFCRLRATECSHLYPDRYRRKAGELNDEIVLPLKDFLEKIIKLRVGESSLSEVDMLEVVRLTRLETSSQELQVIIEELRSKAVSDEEQITLEEMKHEPRDEVHRAAILNDVKRMVSVHFGCKYYVDQLGDSVFIQARYDLFFRQNPETSSEQEDMEYRRAWLMYGICKSLLDRASYVASSLIELVQEPAR